MAHAIPEAHTTIEDVLYPSRQPPLLPLSVTTKKLEKFKVLRQDHSHVVLMVVVDYGLRGALSP